MQPALWSHSRRRPRRVAGKISEDSMNSPFNREAENLGNITGLEHVNVEIPDQGLASDFYLMGLGLTRDPYLFPGTNNMWINLGIPYVEFTVPEKTAKGIARFYRKVLGAITCIEKNGDGKAAHIKVGPHQELIFRETDKKLPEFDGHHLQVYVEDFGKPHEKLRKLDLITEESDRCQYRF